MTEDDRVSWFSLFAGLLAAALATAAAVVYTQRGWGHASAGPVFLFAFAYAFAAGLVIGLPVLGRMVKRGRLNGRTAAYAGAIAAAFPGLVFVLFVASCANNGVVMGIAACTEGVRNLAGWGFSAALVAALAAMGAAAGLVGFLVYAVMRRIMLAQPHEDDLPDPPPE
ncbi:MAG: hypothetical protein JNL56_07960 [Alphaproteobacteria bacterium]|nr:hypothetical protein [Alphaproteobacteria bacterium]